MSRAFEIGRVGTLAMLGEQLAVLARAASLGDLSTTIDHGLKWIVPVRYDRLLVRVDAHWQQFPGGTQPPLSPWLQSIVEEGTDRYLSVDAAGGDGGSPYGGYALRLLDEGELVGILVVELTAPSPLDRDAEAILRLYALGVAGMLAKLLLLDRERIARATALAAAQSRDDLIASLIHDFRSPLAATLLSIECMELIERRGDSTKETRLDLLDEIKRGCLHMQEMLDDELDTAQSGAGIPMELNLGIVDLVALVRLVCATVERSSGHAVVVDAPEHPVFARVDGARLRRGFVNLVENAAKYSPAGSDIEVGMVLSPRMFVVAVRDQGIGIPPEDLPRLFQRFRRASNVGGIAGTGLGLATAREIFECHGGTLTVESLIGVGSTFEVRLPVGSDPGS